MVGTIGTAISSVVSSNEDRTLFIKPNSGYVVSSSSFDKPMELPAGITSIIFRDSYLPGEIGNEVEVVITLDATYLLTATNANISLGLIGDADIYVKPAAGEKSVLDAYFTIPTSLTNCTVSYVAHSGFSVSWNGIVTGKVKSGIPKKAARVNVKANADYNFLELPVGTITSNRPELSVTVQNLVKDDDGRIDSYSMEVYYTAVADSVKADKVSVDITANAKGKRAYTREISDFSFKESVINPLGENKKFTITGSPGAEFTVTVARVSDSAVIHTTTSGVITGSDNEDYSSTYEIGTNSYSDITVAFPKNIREYPSPYVNVERDDSYTVTIAVAAGTTLNSRVAVSRTLYQYVNPKIIIGNRLNGVYAHSTDQGALPNTTVTAEYSITGRPNKTGKELSYLKDVASKHVEMLYTASSPATALTLNSPALKHKVIRKKGKLSQSGLTITLNDTDGVEDILGGATVFAPNAEGAEYDSAGSVFVASVSNSGVVSITSTDFSDAWDDVDNVDNIDFYFLKSCFVHNVDVTAWGVRFLPSSHAGRDDWDITITKLTGTQVDALTVKVSYNITINKWGNMWDRNQAQSYGAYGYPIVLEADNILTETT
jgi:hypothetical protein